MDKIAKDIYKAICQNKWVEIEYKNRQGSVTCYWIGVKAVDPVRRTLLVDGFNVSSCSMMELSIYFDSIIGSNIVEDSYYETDADLLSDMVENEEKYKGLFDHDANMRILDYYIDCCRLDTAPTKVKYGLVDRLDLKSIGSGHYHLNPDQFNVLVRTFHRTAKNADKQKEKITLCVNRCSVHVNHNLYVLAYVPVYFDVKGRTLVKDDSVVVCEEFTVDGQQLAIRRFIGEENMYLLDDYEANEEKIKEIIAEDFALDDSPYFMEILREFSYIPEADYRFILRSMSEDKATFPIRAFFGQISKKPEGVKKYPLALSNRNANVDQIRTIHNGMKYPLLYVQGPPGTGKTNTILNTVATLFYNGKTALISSYNNHPMDEIYEKLCSLEYKGRRIPFPVVRLGNNKKVEDAILHISNLYEMCRSITYDQMLLDCNEDSQIKEAEKLDVLLSGYEKKKELEEKKQVIQKMLSSMTNMQIWPKLQGEQMERVNKELSEISEVSVSDIESIKGKDWDEYLRFMYYTSAMKIQKLSEAKYEDLFEIVYESPLSIKERAKMLNAYLQNEDNMRLFLKIFPVVVTTNISANKLGMPGVYFDQVIIDEASQCTTAMSLVPILRGRELMLVGDPQQLQPVILLNRKNNEKLKKKYNISGTYDYIENSLYKTFLATESVCEDVMLRYHYRCDPRIISFNNNKYYNRELKIETEKKLDVPLMFIDCRSGTAGMKNTSEVEAYEIVQFIKAHEDLDIGIITPFVNQKALIRKVLNEKGLDHVTCGTVHAFQGDEKDVILFSLAITKKTNQGTYSWLKNNHELINVATSRAKHMLVVLGDEKEIYRLHMDGEADDLYELFQFVKSGGVTKVSAMEGKDADVRIRAYNLEDEDIFLQRLNHVANSLALADNEYTAKAGVESMDLFKESDCESLDVTFDYVLYENGQPIFITEIVGWDSFDDSDVKVQKRKAFCEERGIAYIRIPVNYSRRYNYIKEILEPILTAPQSKRRRFFGRRK